MKAQGDIPGLSKDHILDHYIGLCSIEEQRAIVSKIELLFSELDNGIANLKLAQEQLKVYRQAVLKNAFEGELTREWRKLNSLLYEWESKQLNEIAKFIDYRGKTPQKTDYGITLITAKNVRMGFINEEPREFIAENDYDKWMTRGIPKKGDILFTTEAPLGYVAQLNTDEKIALAQRLITFQPIKIVTCEYLKYYLMSPKFQTKLHLNSTGTTVKGIKAATLKKLSIDIPSIEEQQAIVQEIETRLSVCDKIEQDIKENLEKAEALRQSILKKAFEGKLLNEKELAEVRRTEDWEPAEVLLERIKAEREGNGKNKKQIPEQSKKIIRDEKGLIQQATLQVFEQIDN
jgi:type I restriction enzyme, S subunit